MNDEFEQTIETAGRNRVDLTEVHELAGFEEKFSKELAAIQEDVAAYQHAFGEPLKAPPVRVNVWKLGAPEVHLGGHQANLWTEKRQDRYGRDFDVVVIQNIYHPRENIRQVTTFELSKGRFKDAESVVALKMVHEELEAKPYEMKTLLPDVSTDRFDQMVATIRSQSD